MKTILGGVVGKISIPSPAMLVALLALLLAASGAAVAAGSFTASDGTITACRDNKTGVLRVINAQGGQACSAKETTITWKDGITGKVADSDKLDNKDSSEFLGANQKAADSSHADSATSAEDANTLDGKDSTDFYAAGSKVADSAHADLADSATSADSAGDANTLDGKDSSAFADKAEASGVDFAPVPTVSLQDGNYITNSEIVGSLRITAPADGFVVVTATGWFRASNPDGGQIDMYTLLGPGISPEDADRSTTQAWSVPDGVQTSREYFSPFSITKTFPVTAGGHTYSVFGGLVSGTTTTTNNTGDVVSGNMTAYYIKNRY